MTNRIPRNRNNPHIINTAHQEIGDDVIIVPPNQSGDSRIWGHWIWEGDSNECIAKINSGDYPTDVSQYVVPNYREMHRSSLGIAGTGTGGNPTAYGSNAWWTTGTFTELYNFMSSTAMTDQGLVTIPVTGYYMFTYSGFMSSSGGSITSYQCLLRRIVSGVPSFIGSGGFSMILTTTRVNLYQRFVVFAAANEVWHPGIFVSVSAGTVTLNTMFWQVECLAYG